MDRNPRHYPRYQYLGDLMSYENHYILNVILPAVEREGLTIKTNYGEVTLNPKSPSVISFIAALRIQFNQPEKRQSPVVPF